MKFSSFFNNIPRPLIGNSVSLILIKRGYFTKIDYLVVASGNANKALKS